MRFLDMSGKPKMKETSQLSSIHLSRNQILNDFYALHEADPQTHEVNAKCIAYLVSISRL